MDVADNPRKYFWFTLLNSSSFMAPVITLFYFSRGLDYQQIFMLLLAIVVAMFLSEVPTGIIGDKYGRKTSIIIGQVLGIVVTGLTMFAHSFLFFLILSFCVGIVVTFASGSDEALLYDSLKQLKKEKDMNRVMGRISGASFIPVVISAPIGAFIARNLTDTQFNTLILLNVISSAIALFIAFGLVEPRIGQKKSGKKSSWELFKSSYRDIKNSPTLVRLFINKTLVLIVCSHVFSVLWQPYLKDSGVPIAAFGILVAFGAAIIALCSRYIEKIERFFRTEKLFFYSALLPLIFFAAAALLHNIIFAVLFYLVINIMLWIRYPVFSQYMNTHIKSHNRATVLSALSMVDSLFDIVIFLTVGFISNVNLSYSLLFCAAIILLALVFFRIRDDHISKNNNENNGRVHRAKI